MLNALSQRKGDNLSVKMDLPCIKLFFFQYMVALSHFFVKTFYNKCNFKFSFDPSMFFILNCMMLHVCRNAAILQENCFCFQMLKNTNVHLFFL